MRIKTIPIFTVLLLLISCIIIVKGGIGDEEDRTLFFGTVNDKYSGEAVPEARIEIFDENFIYSYVTISDDTGYFEIELEKGGDYLIECEKDGYWLTQEEKNIHYGEEKELTIFIKEIECEFHGVFIDSETGETITNERIYIDVYDEKEGFPHYYYDLNRESGEYRIQIDNGSYYLVVDMVDNYQYFKSELLSIDVDEIIEYNIELTPINNGVYGNVTDENGEPINEVYVIIENDEGIYDDSTHSGYYYIGAPPGDYIIQFYENGYKFYKDTITIKEDEFLEYDVSLEEAKVPILYYFISMIWLFIGSLY